MNEQQRQQNQQELIQQQQLHEQHQLQSQHREQELSPQSISNSELPNDNVQIHAAKRNKFMFLYVTNLDPQTSVDMLKSFVAKKLKIPSNEVSCISLVKKNCVLEDLEFISFKLGLREDQVSKVMMEGFWPEEVICREFQPRPRH